MRLTAYTIEGVSEVWDSWRDVEAWMLEGPKLIMRLRESGRTVLKTVVLPRHVVGLADDGPTRVAATSDSRSTSYHPAPKDHRSEPEPTTAKQLRIPDRGAPRSRFGDSPRRRQFKGDGL